uniref:winged helix-turn-helix domain-containing protein n=1 Tax=Thaumasiovibrio occultus TaxID=1891184 RepID=UPI000B34D0AD|nr:helix-turn-helix domain-containing protein [Thaumasiovibrio occultus]
MKSNPSIKVVGNFLWEVDSRKLTRIAPEKTNDGVTEGGEQSSELLLTPKQYRLLKCLFDAHPQTLPNDNIVEYVWNGKPTSPESLPQLIKRTRLALEDTERTILVNEPGVGYRLAFTECAISQSAPRSTKLADQAMLRESWRNNVAVLWPAIALIAGMLTIYHLSTVADAWYFKPKFDHLQVAKPYPFISESEGKTELTIDGHQCIYIKERRLIRCTLPLPDVVEEANKATQCTNRTM